MPQHRLRLSDGSVINLERGEIREWFERGLVSAESQVQPPGSREWTRLAAAMDVRQWRAPGVPRGVSVPAGASRTPKSQGPSSQRAAARSSVAAGGPRLHAGSFAWRPSATAALMVTAALLLAAGGWAFYLHGPAAAPVSRPEVVDAAVQPPAGVPQAVVKVVEAVPFLTPHAAERLMAYSAAEVLEPTEAFRRAYLMTSRGLPALDKREQAELGALTTQMYSSVPARDRERLGHYIEQVRRQHPTAPTLDAEMSRIARGAVLKLPAARRARLQASFEKAIVAGLQVR